MFQGLRTVIYQVNDLDKAKEWYTKILGAPPYFDESYYVGFDVDGFELGLMPDEEWEKAENVLAYWQVADIHKTYKHLLSHGATEHDPVQEVGDGIYVASVYDPFGNILGIITTE
ncbi:MAG TPA: VOC family protein [Candidatus Dependentiae bacterium]|nr:VOC family protein [Candidatus Dependentiae bacterium]HRQ62626.1 VOC family protein [Candidatus Dependentiae bacterium]